MNCSRNPIGDEDCSHFEDAGVVCQGMHTLAGICKAIYAAGINGSEISIS